MDREKAVIAFNASIRVLWGELVGLDGGAAFDAGIHHLRAGRAWLAAHRAERRETGMASRCHVLGTFTQVVERGLTRGASAASLP